MLVGYYIIYICVYGESEETGKPGSYAHLLFDGKVIEKIRHERSVVSSFASLSLFFSLEMYKNRCDSDLSHTKSLYLQVDWRQQRKGPLLRARLMMQKQCGRHRDIYRILFIN